VPLGALVPAVVVVDTWNVRGQCYDLLGERRFPSVDGIRRGLGAYGFEVLHVYAAAAVDRQPGGVSAALEQRLAMTDRFAAAVEAHPRGTVLRGRIAERDGVPEEKLVDVLCALRVLRCATEISTGRTPARAVVVLSEDIDLSPSYEMAAELGVPVYAAANETVHTRPGSWLVLGDAAMIDFCGRAEGATQGCQRRAALVTQLRTAGTARTWKPRHIEAGQQVLRHRTGIEGTWSGRSSGPVSLYPAGVDLGRRRQGFPRLRLADHPARPAELTEATVVQWSQPTRVEVVYDDGRVRTVDAAPGGLLSGMRTLVDTPRSGPTAADRRDRPDARAGRLGRSDPADARRGAGGRPVAGRARTGGPAGRARGRVPAARQSVGATR
jgi:hypothetical protein